MTWWKERACSVPFSMFRVPRCGNRVYFDRNNAICWF